MKSFLVGFCIVFLTVAGFAASIELVSYTNYVSDGYLHLIGVVKNISQKNLQYVKVVYTLYDNDDNPVDTDFTYSFKNILMPGEESPYEIMMKDVDWATCDISMTSRTTSEKPYTGLQLSKSNQKSEYGYTHVIGTVKNIGDKEVKYVKVMGAFYDKSDKLIRVGFTYTTIDELAPWQRTPFDMMLDIPSDEIDHYSLWVQASVV